jgi:hypothetical protein
MLQEVYSERGTVASVWTGRLLSAAPGRSDNGREALHLLSRGSGVRISPGAPFH